MSCPTKTDNEKASWKLNNQEYENPWKYFEKKYWSRQAEVEKICNVQWNETEILITLKKRVLGYNFIKSLILAQDERWRHA